MAKKLSLHNGFAIKELFSLRIDNETKLHSSIPQTPHCSMLVPTSKQTPPTIEIKYILHQPWKGILWYDVPGFMLQRSLPQTSWNDRIKRIKVDLD